MTRFRLALWPTIFTIPALILMATLGWWQLERREWKHDLFARLETRLAAPPTSVEDVESDPQSAEFRRISVSGHFLHENEMHYPGRTLDGVVGFEIMTPLVTDAERVVLVDRGWVPQAARDPATRPDSQPPGLVTVEGVVRLPPERGWFTPQNAPDQNQWFSVDLDAAARSAGIDPARMLPFYVVASPSATEEGLPVPRGSRIDLPDNHLQYAITWLSLAAALLVIYVLYIVRRNESA